MTRYIKLNVKISNLQLNKLKSGMKNGAEITLNLWSEILMMKLVFDIN